MFWHPLPLWQVIAIGFVAQLVCQLIVVALREGLGLQLSGAAGGGAGGFLMVVVVMGLAKQKAARDQEAATESSGR